MKGSINVELNLKKLGGLDAVWTSFDNLSITYLI